MDMDVPMAYAAKRDEIFCHIPSQLAAGLHMMNLQIFGASASLASPTIALEHLLAEHSISVPIQAKSGLSGHGQSHDAFGTRDKNSWRWEFGRSRKIRLRAKSRESELPESSKFAPARKSAQIISRQ